MVPEPSPYIPTMATGRYNRLRIRWLRVRAEPGVPFYPRKCKTEVTSLLLERLERITAEMLTIGLIMVFATYVYNDFYLYLTTRLNWKTINA
jgi:hypothetical protein